jgi:hypothetical protein
MITFLLTILYTFLQWIISQFPAGEGFPSQIHDSATTLGGYLKTIDSLVPLSTLKWCLLLVFSVEIAFFAFKTFKWIISHIPQFGGKGN